MKKMMVVMVMGMVAAASQATLLFYDDFSSAAGSLLGTTPDTGTAWNYKTNSPAGDAYKVIATGLTAPSGFSAATGGAAAKLANGNDSYSTYTGAPATNDGNSIYYSFLFSSTQAVTAASTAGRIAAIGRDYGSDYATIRYDKVANENFYKLSLVPRGSGTGYLQLPDQLAMGSTHLIVVSYTYVEGTTNDMVRVWLNPDSATFNVETAPTATLPGSGTSADLTNQFNSVRLGGPSGTPNTVMVDELRVGTTWADVTPSGMILKNIETSSDLLSITEGTTNNFHVRLNSQPDASITVRVSRVSSETSIVVLPDPTILVFAVTNWSVWQSVYVEALSDVDTNSASATITCTDLGGTYSTKNVTATQIEAPVLVIPVALFNAAPILGYAPLPVTFTDASTGTITNRFWDFGDGVTTNTTSTSVSHTYTVAGSTSIVQLIVSGPLGASTNAQGSLIRVLPGTAPSLPIYNSFSDSVSTSAIPVGWFCIAPGSNTAHSSITSGSLSFAGLQASAGNSWGLAQKTDDYTQDFTPSNLSINETIYFSFLMRMNSPLDAFNSVQFRLYDSADVSGSGVNASWGTSATNGFGESTTMGFSIDNRNRNWSTATIKTPDTYTAADTVYLIVASYTRGSASTNGSVRLWVNPDSATFGTSTPPTATLATNSYASDAVWNRLEFISNGSLAGVPSWQVDEVRIATSWAGVVPSVDGIPDSNGDGIPDSWSTLHFGGPTNANASALAANGINTILEAYIAGLNPTNAQSVLALSLQQGSSQSLLQWSAVSGRVYSVYWTTNLISGFQSLETNIVWPQNSWTGQVSGSRADFYKIKVQMAP